ncbi:hypothetical protein [Deinococcus humi]|uniref:Uncharacterized protein n=1 Tax=Deinococcus humi TaxID=662880 RepID=A0A7W8ND81_9DEIO|nr:hypothetical protein [Deinococcus humi]MBB5362071.1 hypothetical protein [Deinococcus humi]GGO22222.1 hypothetical protein GCM10008949_09240 [Deinococcus humi]
MTWPYRLIVRGVQIERQREAAAQLARLRLSAVADSTDLGREYVDPDNPSGQADTSKPHHTLRPYLQTEQALERTAEPWRYTEDALIRRRIREEDADFARFEQAMGLQA